MKHRTCSGLFRLKQQFSRPCGSFLPLEWKKRTGLPPRTSRGSTLYEVVIAIALIAIVTTMSVNALDSAQRSINSYLKSSNRMDELSNLRESVSVWFDSHCSDVYDMNTEPMYLNASPEQEAYTVVFIDRTTSARHSLCLLNGELIEKTSEGARVLTSVSDVQAVSFILRDQTGLVRCSVRFSNGETAVFMLRRHT